MNKSDLIKWLRNEAGSINPDPAVLTSAIAEIESLRTQVASLELKLKLAVRSPAEDLIEAELKREQQP